MLEAIIYKHGNDDFSIWYPDLPEEAQKEIEAILDVYTDRGYSVRGTAQDIASELV